MCVDGGTLDVAVTLSGVGDLTRGTLFSHVVTKGSTFTEHLHGTERQATAAGSVDGEPIAGTVVIGPVIKRLP